MIGAVAIACRVITPLLHTLGQMLLEITPQTPLAVLKVQMLLTPETTILTLGESCCLLEGWEKMFHHKNRVSCCCQAAWHIETWLLVWPVLHLLCKTTMKPIQAF